MKAYIDLTDNGLITAPGIPQPVTQIRFKRGRLDPLEVQFVDENGDVVHEPATSLSFVAKAQGAYDADPITVALTWEIPLEADEDQTYRCSPGMNTAALNALFAIDADPANDVESVTLMGEINWQQGSSGVKSTKTFEIVVDNDVLRDEDTAPDPLESANYQLAAEKGAASGYAGLDADGLVPRDQLPEHPYDFLLGFTGTPEAAQEDSIIVTRPVRIAGIGHTLVAETVGTGANLFDLYNGETKLGEVTLDGVSEVSFGLTGSTAVEISGVNRLRLVAPDAVVDCAGIQVFITAELIEEPA